MRYILILLVLLLGCSQQQEYAMSLPNPEWNSPEIIEEKMWKSDYIVRATLVSVVESAEDRGNGYSGLRTFTFNVHEWLKGTGANQIIVLNRVDLHPGDYDEYGETEEWLETEEDVLRVLKRLPRTTTWDNRQAILFLAKEGANFVFDSGGRPDFNLSIATNIRAWLPATATAPAGDASGDSSTVSFMTANDETSTITLAAFKAKQTEIATAQSSTVEGHSDCVLASIRLPKLYQGQTVTFFEHDFTIDAGVPSQVMTVEDGQDHGLWLKGDDSALFEAAGKTVTNTRPLPAGEYIFTRHYQSPRWVPCNFRPEYNGPESFTVTVTTDEDVDHEAFFDPMDRRSGLRVGELNLSDHVSRLLWFSDGTPRVEIETSTKLTNKVVEIIDAAGAVAHAFYSADSKPGRTLSWPVAGKPWSAGGHADGPDKGGSEQAASLLPGQILLHGGGEYGRLHHSRQHQGHGS